jgi:uncharacterized protein YwlG (UPF0340 family)
VLHLTNHASQFALHNEERIHIAIGSSSMVINGSKIPSQNSHNEQKLVLRVIEATIKHQGLNLHQKYQIVV